MQNDFIFKDKYSFADLQNIVSILRAPGGCPWDIEQTHESLKKDLIEECYEVIEAINKENPDMLREELGDVLLQVVFHSDIEREKGVFNIEDVCDEICKKLIIRHPHVFGDVNVDSTEEVLKNWDEIKMQTKSQKSASESMASVPRELPALMRGQKIQHKARKVGFDWQDPLDAIKKVHEEADEVAEAIGDGDAAHTAEEVGDLLFAAVNVARLTGVEAEEVMTAATDKFFKRFTICESLAKDRGIDMSAAGLEELDKLWDEAKQISK